MKNKKIFIISTFFSVLILLIALSDNPYGYYQFLRWIITGFAVYSIILLIKTIELNDSNKKIKKFYYYLLVFIYGLIAVLYNPFSPFYLNRDTWKIINIFTIIILIIGLLSINFKRIKIKYNNFFSISCFLFGILSMYLHSFKIIYFPLLAIIFGILSLSNYKKIKYENKTISTIGLSIGLIQIFFYLIINYF